MALHVVGGGGAENAGVENFRGVSRGAEPAPLNAANIRPNAIFTSLKYIEHDVIFHPLQRSNQKFIKSDRPARYLSI